MFCYFTIIYKDILRLINITFLQCFTILYKVISRLISSLFSRSRRSCWRGAIGSGILTGRGARGGGAAAGGAGFPGGGESVHSGSAKFPGNCAESF